MRQSLGLYQRGFSVLELILTVTLLLGVAAVVVPGPLPDPQSEEEKLAHAECRAISAALLEFEAETGFAPAGRAGKQTFSWLRGPGVAPEFNSHPGGKASNLSWFLSVDKMSIGEKWGGPYIDSLNPDPWGRRYVVLLKELSKEAQARTWVISAGPDGVIDTGLMDTIPGGDDIGTMVE